MPPAAPFDVEIHEIELCSVLKAQEEDAGEGRKNLSEMLMDEEEEEEAEEKETKTQDGNREEQTASSEAVKEKPDMTR